MTAIKQQAAISGTEAFLSAVANLPESDAIIARQFGCLLRRLIGQTSRRNPRYRFTVRELDGWSALIAAVFKLDDATPPEGSLHALANAAYLGPDGGFVLRCNTEADPDRTVVIEVHRPTTRTAKPFRPGS